MYATRRDLRWWQRPLFWALLGPIAFGIVAIFVAIPAGNVIHAVACLAIFGAFTVFDFNRLVQNCDDSAVLTASSIFLDVFNMFLFALDLLGGRREERRARRRLARRCASAVDRVSCQGPRVRSTRNTCPLGSTGTARASAPVGTYSGHGGTRHRCHDMQKAALAGLS